MNVSKRKNKFMHVILIFALCIILPTQLLACHHSKPTVQTGIEVLPKPTISQTYSDDARAFALNATTNLLTEIYRLKTPSLSQKMKDEINAHSTAVEKIFASQNLSESAFISIFENIEENCSQYANAFSSLSSKENSPTTKDTLKRAISFFSSTIGIEQFASITFDVCLYCYDFSYQESMDRYDKYGFAYLLEDAEQALSDKNTLQNEISKSNFIPATKLMLFISQLFAGGAFDSPLIESFSTAEILVLIKAPNFSSLNVSASGWQLLFRLFSALFPLSSSQSSIFSMAEKNGDLLKFSQKANLVIELITTVQNNLNEQSVSILLGADAYQFTAHCFSCFDDETWSLFESATDLELNNEDYNAQMQSLYGNAYADYLNNLPSVSLQDLKTAQEQDFGSLLINYFAGICPAFFYGDNA